MILNVLLLERISIRTRALEVVYFGGAQPCNSEFVKSNFTDKSMQCPSECWKVDLRWNLCWTCDIILTSAVNEVMTKLQYIF